MSRSNLAATWRERLKGAVRLVAILIGANAIPLAVKTFYTGQGSILDILNAWLLVGPLLALTGFILPVGAGPFTPLPPRERRKVALVTAAVCGLAAAMLELLITSDAATDRIGATVTTALLAAAWMGLTMYVLAPATRLRTTTTSTNQRQNV